MSKIESIKIVLVEENYTVTVTKVPDEFETAQIYVSYGGSSIHTALDVARGMALAIGNH